MGKYQDFCWHLTRLNLMGIEDGNCRVEMYSFTMSN
jgi:hypothetical protein